MSTRAKNSAAHPGLVDISPPASPKGSGAGKVRASNAKAQQARHVGSMSLDEKLKLLEEVTAALNKEQNAGGRYLPASKYGTGSGPSSGGSEAMRHPSVPPSTPQGSSERDVKMADEIVDHSIEMTPTETYDSDVNNVLPATELNDEPEQPAPEPEPIATVSAKGKTCKRMQDEDDDGDNKMDGSKVPADASTSTGPVPKKVKTNIPQGLIVDWAAKVQAAAPGPQSPTPSISMMSQSRSSTPSVVSTPSFVTCTTMASSAASHAAKKAQRQTSQPEKGKKVNQADLPLPTDVADALEIWQQKVVPTYISFIGSLKNPWDPNSTKREIKELQRVWSKVFPTSNEVIEDGCVIHKVAMQRSYEYRNNISKAAAVAISRFWETAGIDSEGGRIKYIQENLHPSFKCMMSDPEVERGFAQWKTGHIQSRIELAAIVKACATESEQKLVEKSHAALTCFSRVTWGDATMEYTRSTINITKGMWKSIMAKAQVYAKAAKCHDEEPNNTGCTSGQDARALLVKASHDDDDDDDDADADDEDGGIGEDGDEESMD
ncbi:hypothetical protein PHLCEN_2v1956 [Hermanssonia centrifuga]|uniref:Uncharacterized protein n=1 Tax=Hermanssonia centrifuga TaxID=98765 RepID=A0A2R6RVG7_9APHY|nr:hypothetical protein PHLCEN_2v1956 [Hermanssonia centrifuga]